MSVEEALRAENARLRTQVDQLRREADKLQSSATFGAESEQVQALKAELDHERQKAKAIWAAVRQVTGEDAARRIEEEVSRRPIVAAPKVRRRGTMPHMPAPHMTVVAKTAAAPKWPPVAQEEPPASEVPVQVVVEPIEEDDSEGPKPDFEVNTDSVPPSVARRLFDSGCKAKEPASASSESLPVSSIKLDCTSEPASARVADIPSPLRHRESSSSLSWAPPMPRPYMQQQREPQAKVRSVTPTPQVHSNGGSECRTTPTCSDEQPKASSVRDRIRQLELSARRSSNTGKNLSRLR